MTTTITRLIILRHAHAAKAESGQADYDRPLDARGLREAAEAGREIAALVSIPAAIVCSGSARTRQTLAGLGHPFAGIQAVFDDTLYHDGVEAYLTAARNSAGDGPIMLVGHNPSVAETIALLAGDAEPAAARRLGEGVPPGAFALLEFPGAPARIDRQAGFLRHFFRPGRP